MSRGACASPTRRDHPGESSCLPSSLLARVCWASWPAAAPTRPPPTPTAAPKPPSPPPRARPPTRPHPPTRLHRPTRRHPPGRARRDGYARRHGHARARGRTCRHGYARARGRSRRDRHTARGGRARRHRRGAHVRDGRDRPAAAPATTSRASRNHCGACGNACPDRSALPGRHAASWSAWPEMNPRNGVCVNFATDRANGCACGMGLRWRARPATAGVCVTECAMGQTACGATRYNLQTDNAHCGACGNGPRDGSGVRQRRLRRRLHLRTDPLRRRLRQHPRPSPPIAVSGGMACAMARPAAKAPARGGPRGGVGRRSRRFRRNPPGRRPSLRPLRQRLRCRYALRRGRLRRRPLRDDEPPRERPLPHGQHLQTAPTGMCRSAPAVTVGMMSNAPLVGTRQRQAGYLAPQRSYHALADTARATGWRRPPTAASRRWRARASSSRTRPSTSRVSPTTGCTATAGRGFRRTAGWWPKSILGRAIAIDTITFGRDRVGGWSTMRAGSVHGVRGHDGGGVCHQ